MRNCPRKVTLDKLALMGKLAHMRRRRPPPDLVGTAQAAEILGVSVATVNRWALSGRLEPVVEIPGRTGARLFLRSDVEELAGEHASA